VSSAADWSAVFAGYAATVDWLGVPVPDEPYPRLNDPGRFWARVQARIDEALR
jgi:hypothetical protein